MPAQACQSDYLENIRQMLGILFFLLLFLNTNKNNYLLSLLIILVIEISLTAN